MTFRLWRCFFLELGVSKRGGGRSDTWEVFPNNHVFFFSSSRSQANQLAQANTYILHDEGRGSHHPARLYCLSSEGSKPEGPCRLWGPQGPLNSLSIHIFCS